MGTFDSGPDPRRVGRRTAGQLPDDLAAIVNRGVQLPGSVHQEQSPRTGLVASKVNFDRASFGYDDTSYINYFVKGTTDAAPNWTKIGGGGGGNDIRAYVGPTTDPLYAWVFGSFNWKTAAGVQGRVCAALYESGLGGQVAYARSDNYISHWVSGDLNYRQLTYVGFLNIPVVDGADWYIGLQQQVIGAGVTNQSAGRQSMVCFVTALPDDGSDTTTQDSTLA